MSENPVLGFSHVSSELVSQFLLVVLHLQLNPVGLLYLDVELLARALEVAVNSVSHFVVRAMLGMLVDHDPRLVLHVHSFLYRQLSEHVLVNVNDLAALEDLGGIHNPGLDLDWHGFDPDVPLLKGFLSLKGISHLLDFRDLFVRADVSSLKGLSHSWAALHAF